MPRERSKQAQAARDRAASVLRRIAEGEKVTTDAVADALALLFMTNVDRRIVERYGRMRRAFSSGEVLCWAHLVGPLCPCVICSDPGSFDAALARDDRHRSRVYLVGPSSVRGASAGAPLRSAMRGHLTRYALAYCEHRAEQDRAEGTPAKVLILTGEGAQDPDEPATDRAWSRFFEIARDPAWLEDWIADVDEATRGRHVELHAGRGWWRLAGRPETWDRPAQGQPHERARWYRDRIDLP